MTARIRIGTSGFAYEDWVARPGEDDAARGQGLLFEAPAPAEPAVPAFYPRGVKDKLAYYATVFDTVEINSSYYHVPARRDVEGWVRRTPADFSFWVKVHGDTTHAQDRAAAPPLLDAVAPLRDAGKLAGLLAQFPESFRNVRGSYTYLEHLAVDFPDDPIVVEFRHRSWDRHETLRLLDGLGLQICAVDEPDLPSLFPSKPVRLPSAGRRRAAGGRGAAAAYLRLHSRAAHHWYAGEALRYDYLYSEAELSPWARWLSRVAEEEGAPGVEVYAFFNNCKRSQAAANARRVQALIGEQLEAGGPDRRPRSAR